MARTSDPRSRRRLLAVTISVLLALTVCLVVPLPVVVVIPGQASPVNQLLDTKGSPQRKRDKVTAQLISGGEIRPTAAVFAAIAVRVDGYEVRRHFSTSYQTHGQGSKNTFAIAPLVGAEKAGAGNVPKIKHRGPLHGRSGALGIAMGTFQLLTTSTCAGAFGATGSIDADGKIWPINHIRAKVLTARREGLGVLLVPSENSEEAKSAASEDLEIVPVHDIDEAAEWLESKPCKEK